MDNLTKKQRSYAMSRVKSKNTDIEKIVFGELKRMGVKFSKHGKHLPGNPDAVILSQKTAIFINGDFWHGWQFSRWKNKLPNRYWKDKIQNNRMRDRKSIANLNRMGWKTIVIWEHELKKDDRRKLVFK